MAVPDDRGLEVALLEEVPSRAPAPPVERRPARWPWAVAAAAVLAALALLRTGDGGGEPGAAEPDLPDRLVTAGDLQWAVRVPGVAGRHPAIAGDTVVVATDDGRLVGLGRGRGDQRWTAPAAGPDPTEPVAFGPYIVTASGATMTAVLAAGGSPGWTMALPSPVELKPAVAGSRLVVVADDGRVWGVDGHRGRVLWELAVAPPVPLPPVADDGTAVVAGGRGGLVVDVQRGTGTALEGEQIAGMTIVQDAPYVLQGEAPIGDVDAVAETVVIGLQDGTVRGLVRGEERWSRRASTGITGVLAIRHDVVVTTLDGWLHRLEGATGRRISSLRSGPGAKTTANPGPGPWLFTVDDGDVVAGLRDPAA